MKQIKSFNDFPAVGAECICSLCDKAIFDRTAIRFWNQDESEFRFHPACLEEVAFIFEDDNPRRGRFLPYRISRRIPGKMPFQWQDSMVTAMAVRQYLDHKTIHTPLNDEAKGKVIDYLNHYVWAGCWLKMAALFNLRLRADALETVEDIDGLIAACLEIGIDPL